jgi:adenylate kinase family enzyme
MNGLKKIAIIGCAGSGKTTLAFQLHNKLHLPLHHLDQYYWKPNWQRLTLEEFNVIHEALCEQKQ